MCDGFCARIFSAYPKSLTPLAIPHHRLTFPDPLSRDFRAMAFSNLDVALAYARANLRVFPCGHGKLPLTAGNWLANATTDEKQIRTWWSASPSALIGLPMKPHDLLVFDADRHHDSEDGIAHFRALCAEHEPLPPHPIVLTANGGEHHIFRQPTNKIGNRKLGNGLETRGYKDHNYSMLRCPSLRLGWQNTQANKKPNGSQTAAVIVIRPAIAKLDMRKLRCATVLPNWPHSASRAATIY
jgi:hypothetical protein